MAKIDKQLFDADMVPEPEPCPECGGKLVVQHGKHGAFLGCSSYPTCQYHRPLVEKAAVEPEVLEDTSCPLCGNLLALKSGRYGFFIGCTAHPDCDYIVRDPQPETSGGVTCPKCQTSNLVSRTNKFGKTFYACESYPKCKYSLNFPPVEQACPECGWGVLVEKTVRGQHHLACPARGCKYDSKKV